MDFGIVTAKVDEIGYITHAENLGYSHCWVTDSQMIRSNCWAVLALAAQQTRTMRLGTGVNVPGLRLAPVTANGIATINRLAPGRCFISLGTGHTAMRMLGQKPMRLRPFREYIRVVRALLNGEEVDYSLHGEGPSGPALLAYARTGSQSRRRAARAALCRHSRRGETYARPQRENPCHSSRHTDRRLRTPGRGQRGHCRRGQPHPQYRTVA